MALDKVIDSAELDANLTAVADAIRTKGGTTEALSFPSGFVSAVEGIQAGGGDTSIEDEILMGTISGEYRNERVTKLKRYIFIGDVNLKKVYLPSVTTIQSYAFAECSGLTEAIIPEVTSFGEKVFQKCVALEHVDFPKLKLTAQEPFAYCSSLKSVYLPSTTTLFGVNQAFIDCKALTEVNLPAVKEFGHASFSGCTSLVEVNFPAFDGRTYSNSFLNCASLKKADFGIRMNMNSTKTFYGCTNLEAVIIRGEKLSTMSNVNCFENSGVSNGTGYIYVPASMVDTYKSATNWSTYASQIRAIEDYPEICGGASA